MTCFVRILLLIWLGSMTLVARSYAQDASDTLSTLRSQALKVFLDFNRGDRNFIRTEVQYINYVRDRNQADVHVMVTTRRSGSGGREYTFTFMGQNNYVSMNDTLIFFSNQTDTQDEVRRGYTRVIQMGLMRYVVHTPLARFINIAFNYRLPQRPVTDRWDYWVFRINGNTSMNGEQRRNRYHLNGYISANRITPNWKTRLSVNGTFNEENITLSDGGKVNNTRHSKDFNLLHVKSLSDHWSLGVSNWVSTSTYNNRKLSLGLMPALEYNFYPYVESTRHELRFLYEIGVALNQYEEVTLFDKTEETLYFEKLSIIWENKKQWGQAEMELEGSHMFNDVSFYRIQFSSNLNLRLFTGFSLRLSGKIERIKDQISLAKEAGIDDQEVLLRQRELQTPYRYRANVGLSYTFGSIYTNIVNPRIGR
ncbi:MAG TPA: hypothetical protein DIT99_30225 [Candidatus Latescibacteria bacterium]|nr:hypothetical protein [Candidatus Latescibacterota bacterium]